MTTKCAEYKRSNFVKLERGKFFKEVAKGTSVLLPDPKLAKAFPTSDAVNETLRGLFVLPEQTARITARPRRPALTILSNHDNMLCPSVEFLAVTTSE